MESSDSKGLKLHGAISNTSKRAATHQPQTTHYTITLSSLEGVTFAILARNVIRWRLQFVTAKMSNPSYNMTSETRT
ncbi:hypothetical protein M758_UG066700 [Ceratodon purpureus]|nr:hypothetical protein M758_UG066700 [Ceratodon purpureus]